MPHGHHFLLLLATPTRHLIKALQVILATNINNVVITNRPINLIMMNIVPHLKATILEETTMIPGVTMVIHLMIDMAHQEPEGIDDLVGLSMNKDNRLMTPT